MGPSRIAVETSRGRFAALAEGPAEGPVVLCLHGFPDDPWTFAGPMEALAGAGFRAVAPWMRGYDPSPLDGDVGQEALAEDALAIADALSTGRPVGVVGHDIGSQLAYRLGAAHPERVTRIVALAGPHPRAVLANAKRSPAQWWRSRYIAQMQVPRLPERWLRGDWVRILWGRWSPGFRPPEGHLDRVATTIRRSLPGPVRQYRAPGFEGDPRRVGAAAMVILGAGDGCLAPSLAAGQSAWFETPPTTFVLDACGHWPHLERPDEVLPRVLTFLRG